MPRGAVDISLTDRTGMSAADLRQACALQDADLAGGVPGGHRPDVPGFEHRNAQSPLSEEQRRHGARDPGATTTMS